MIPVPDDTLRCYRVALRLKLPNITSLLEVLCVLPIVSECSVKRTLYDIPHPKKGKAHRIHMPLDRYGYEIDLYELYIIYLVHFLFLPIRFCSLYM